MRRLVLVLAFALAGCGGDSESPGFPDANPGDGGVFCRAEIAVAPADPVAPATLTATASVFSISGFIVISWRVVGPDGEVATTQLDAVGLRVSFPASRAGPYTVDAVLTVGGRACPVTGTAVNVRASGARSLDVRLRYAPLPAHDVPAQLDPQIVTLLGGADMILPAQRVLQAGVLAAGQLTGPSGGLPAYLRLTNAGLGTFELHAGGNGAYGGRVPPGVYDVLVIPHGAGVAPALLGARTIGQLTAGLTLTAGAAVGGVVLSETGAPIPDARVALASGELPPTVVTTAADGTFSARARVEEGPLALSVVPPAPFARLAAQLTAAPDAELEIRLPDLDLVTVSPVLRDAAGAPAPGARVTFIASALERGGTISVGGAAPIAAAASVRATAVAGAGGAVPPLGLPRAVYEAIVEPAPGADDVPATTTVDLETSPASLASAQAVPALVIIRGPSSTLVDGARVIAVARGRRGVGAGVAKIATSNASGTVTLALAAGMPYAVTVEPPAGRRLARARASIVGGAATLELELQAALELRGTVVFPSGAGQAGVRVEATCVECEDPSLPLAETITDATGAFSLWLPDPGEAQE